MLFQGPEKACFFKEPEKACFFKGPEKACFFEMAKKHAFSRCRWECCIWNGVCCGCCKKSMLFYKYILFFLIGNKTLRE
jgi:hypothetical protein